jgi:hypothetical protein
VTSNACIYAGKPVVTRGEALSRVTCKQNVVCSSLTGGLPDISIGYLLLTPSFKFSRSVKMAGDSHMRFRAPVDIGTRILLSSS